MSFTSTASSLSVNGWKGGQGIFKDFALADSANIYANTGGVSISNASPITIDISSTGNAVVIGDSAYSNGGIIGQQFVGKVFASGITPTNTFPSITNTNAIEQGTTNFGRLSISLSMDASGAYAIAGQGKGNPEPASPPGPSIYYAPTANNWSLQTNISPNASDYSAWGVPVNINQNGDIVAIAGRQDITGTRKIETFTRSGTTWSFEDTLVEPQAGDGFGSNENHGFDFNTAGDILAVSAPGYDGAYSNEGAVYIYEKSGSTWSLTHTITLADAVTRSNWGFGTNVKLNNAGNSLIALANPTWPSASGQEIRRFEKQGASWVQTAKITATDTLSGGTVNELGVLGLDADKNTQNIIIAQGIVSPNPTYGRTRLYVFQNEGTSYVQSQEIFNITYNVQNFGRDVSITNDGTKFVCTDSLDAIYLYTT